MSQWYGENNNSRSASSLHCGKVLVRCWSNDSSSLNTATIDERLEILLIIKLPRFRSLGAYTASWVRCAGCDNLRSFIGTFRPATPSPIDLFVIQNPMRSPNDNNHTNSLPKHLPTACSRFEWASSSAIAQISAESSEFARQPRKNTETFCIICRKALQFRSVIGARCEAAE